MSTDANWRSWLDQLREGPHGALAVSLGELLKDSERLAQGLQDAALREALKEQLGQGLRARLQRFQKAAADEASFQERWVEPELDSALDVLAQLESRARAEHRAGHAPAGIVADELARRTRQLDRALLDEGWPGVQPVRPFETRFEPRAHKAVGQRPRPGCEGLVVEVVRAGRVDQDGRPVRKAQVVVGAR